MRIKYHYVASIQHKQVISTAVVRAVRKSQVKRMHKTVQEQY